MKCFIYFLFPISLLCCSESVDTIGPVSALNFEQSVEYNNIVAIRCEINSTRFDANQEHKANGRSKTRQFSSSEKATYRKQLIELKQAMKENFELAKSEQETIGEIEKSILSPRSLEYRKALREVNGRDQESSAKLVEAYSSFFEKFPLIDNKTLLSSLNEHLKNC